MAARISLAVLVENSVSQPRLQAEHGFSIWLETPDGGLLFDTGQTNLVTGNARAMGIALAEVRAVVLSHGHYDHTGGLASVLSAARTASIWLHPEAAQAKYTRNADGSGRFIGMPEPGVNALAAHGMRVRWTERLTEVLPGVYVTGALPRPNAFEDPGGPFFTDANCQQPDPLMDDQGLFFDTATGLVVILGCAHAGVLNTLQHVQTLTGRPIHAVMGGMHLFQASAERLAVTMEGLAAFDVACLGLAHCTGMPAAAALWTRFPGRCIACSVGMRLGWDR